MAGPQASRYPLALDDAARARESEARPLTLDSDGLADLECLLLGGYAPLDHAEPGAECPLRFHVDDATRIGEILALRDAQGVIYAVLRVTSVSSDVHGRPAANGVLTPVRLPNHPDHSALRALPHEVAAASRTKRSILWFADHLFLAQEEVELVRLLQSGFERVLIVVPAPFTSAGDLRLGLRVRLACAARDAVDRDRIQVIVATVAGAERDVHRRAVLARSFGANAIAAADPQLAEQFATLALEAIPVQSTAARLEQEFLSKGLDLPPAAARPEVRAWLERVHPPRSRQGFTLWLTGLSQSGKSTIAARVAAKLVEYGRASTFLDGDVVRTHLSKGLGFSREDRDLNIRRIGFVAAEITRHGGAVIVAAIAPYRAIRDENRRRIGNYVEVYVNAPIDVCASRDQKGQYEKARRGEIKGFTGVDDPYEPPETDFLECRTDRESADQSAERIVAHLIDLRYLDPNDAAS